VVGRVVAIVGLLASVAAACSSPGGTPDGGIDGKPDGNVQDAPPDGIADVTPDATDAPVAEVSSDATDAPVEAAFDAPVEAAVDAPVEAATDAPVDTVIDAVEAGPDTAPPVVCGDGLVQTGEQCEVPGRLCVDCRITYWASCRYSGDTEPAPCGSYAGADRTRCETLLECVVRNDNVNVCGGANFGNTCVRPAYSASLTGCFCSDDACTKGADGDCAAAFQVAAGSTDLAEVRRQLVTSGTMVNKVATWVARAYCDERCSKYMGGVMIPSGATVGGNWVVVNEVDFVQDAARMVTVPMLAKCACHGTSCPFSGDPDCVAIVAPPLMPLDDATAAAQPDGYTSWPATNGSEIRRRHGAAACSPAPAEAIRASRR